MIRNILIAGALVLSSCATAQTRVTAGVMQGKEYGVTYTLPKTMIELSLDTSKKEYIPGEFAKYASSYLHLEGVQLEPETYWTLDQVKVASVGVPDADKIFFVRMRDKTVAPLMELTNDGIIKTINVPFSKTKTEEQTETLELQKKPNPKDFFTEEILMANSTAKMAELVAKEIYSIRESRNSLLRGEAENTPHDGKQLKLMLDNLEQQEEALTSLFKGQTIIKNKNFTVRIEPTQELNDTIICRFSKRLGVLESDNLAGEPISLSLKDMKTIVFPVDDGKKKVKGIAYNIPGKGYVTIKYNNTIITKGDLPITQFGDIEYLAPELFNKKSKVQAIFDPTTGGLIKVDQEDL